MLAPDDLRRSATVVRQALAPELERDWAVPAGDLAWSCRRTLDHIADSLFFYAAYVARRATGRLPMPRNGDHERSLAELLDVVESAAAILAVAIEATPAGARIFHPAGMADRSGYSALGCEELLVHTADIAQGLGITFRPPDDLTERILARLFPWAPTNEDCWAALLWATGHDTLPDRTRLGPDWYWHCAPLAEWDGTVTKRTAPPAWQ